MAILVVHEDDHLLVINKPAGWNTHAPSPYAGEGVYDWLKHREPRWARLAILHRLDKETSGLLVFGKTPLANKALTEQFTAREVRKTYRLLTDRKVQRAEGRGQKAGGHEFTVVSGIKRAGERYVSAAPGTGGEHAETRFRILAEAPDLTLLEAEPLTGRTHQIRVHAAASGFPILGDVLYGGTRAPRVYLHAAQLAFHHPAGGELIEFEAQCEWTHSVLPIPHSAPPSDLRSSVFSLQSLVSSPSVLCPCGSSLRSAVIDPAQTDAFRLIHGASDGWPGLYVERLGEYLVAQSEQPLTSAQRDWLSQAASTHGASGVYHKLLTRKIRQTAAAQASPRLLSGESAPSRFVIQENGVRFEVSFEEGYSVGLFLDQRDNRRRLLANHIAAGFPVWSKGAAGTELLNVFSYTCGFSVVAAQSGARTTSLDLSRKYLEWGQRNFALNQLDAAQHDFIYGDAFDWMRRLGKKGRLYDVVVLDPPTFSQSRESGIWQAEKDYGRLVEAALPLLKDGGVLFASTNATRLTPEQFVDAVEGAVSRNRRRVLKHHYVPQPPDFPITRDEPGYLKTLWLQIGSLA